MLLPTSVDDYVPPESPIRVIDAFVDVLDVLDLPGCEFLAIDGSFFKAVNRKSRSITKGNLAKMIARIDANIAKYLTRLDQLDTTEVPAANQATSNDPAETIRQKIATISEQRQELQTHFDNCQTSPTGQVNLTDPDSVFLKLWPRTPPRLHLRGPTLLPFLPSASHHQ
jgi:hypothetical protein